MSLKGTIFSVKAGQTVDDDFIIAVLEANQSFGGFAAAVEQDGSPLLVTILNEGPTELADVKDVLEQYKDSTCLWHFGSVEGAFAQTDVQPFTVIEEVDGSPDVVMFMEGMFEDKGGEAEVAEKLVIPFLKRIWKGSADVAEFMEELQTDNAIIDQMKLYYQGRASITILGSNGAQVTFGENALLTEYEWGWTSNPCGYKAEEIVVEPVVAAVPERKFGNTKRVVSAAPVTSASGKTVAVEVKPSATTKVSVPPVAAKAAPDKPEMWGPGPECVTKNQIKQWYITNNNGVVPDSYKNRPLVEKSTTLKSLAELKDRPIASVTPITQPTKVDGTIKKDEAVVASKEVSGDILPVASPKQKEWLQKTFLKRGSVQKTTSDGQTIIDPKRMAATEAKFTTFVEMAGLDSLKDVYHYTPEDRILLCKEAPETAAILIMNLTYALAQHEPIEVAAPVTQTEAPKAPERKFGGGRKVS